MNSEDKTMKYFYHNGISNPHIIIIERWKKIRPVASKF